MKLIYSVIISLIAVSINAAVIPLNFATMTHDLTKHSEDDTESDDDTDSDDDSSTSYSGVKGGKAAAAAAGSGYKSDAAAAAAGSGYKSDADADEADDGDSGSGYETAADDDDDDDDSGSGYETADTGSGYGSATTTKPLLNMDLLLPPNLLLNMDLPPNLLVLTLSLPLNRPLLNLDLDSMMMTINDLTLKRDNQVAPTHNFNLELIIK
ncbi:hypothetical protein BASA83_009752 [Batrachochytrium salamandrivorans]|nr:hypothetical protein BASA83_009752 [Batrachochytrium salamandrivorans]